MLLSGLFGVPRPIRPVSVVPCLRSKDVVPSKIEGEQRREKSNAHHETPILPVCTAEPISRAWLEVWYGSLSLPRWSLRYRVFLFPTEKNWFNFIQLGEIESYLGSSALPPLV
jgi:hypothetical protein